MPESMEWESKTVEEAVESALRSLGVTREEAEISVLQEPSSGFLGLFAKKARVRVTKKAEAPRAAEPPAREKPKAEPAREEAPRTEAPAKEQETGAFAPSSDEETLVFTEAQEMQAKRAVTFLRDIISVMNLDVTVERERTAKGLRITLRGESVGILIGKHGQTLDALQYLTNLAANRGIDEGRLRILVDAENYRLRREETLVRLAQHLAEKACRLGQEVHLEPMNRHERRIIHTALIDNRRVTTYSDGEEPRRYVVIAPKRRRGRRQDSYEGRSRRARVESTPEPQEPYYERGEY